MRAARFCGNKRVAIDHAGRPSPGLSQVRVRLEGTGVCASNLPVWEGRPWFEYPLPAGAPGHEGWGVVDALGDDVGENWLGRRVAMLSSHAFAEWDVADIEGVVPIPAALDKDCCPGEPLACAVNVVERARVAAGETVVVVGVGFLGAAIVALAARAGARVIAVTRRPYARAVAEALGAAATVASGTAAVAQRVSDFTNGQMADCVIEAAGVQETLNEAAPLARVRGRLVIAGYHQDGLRQVNMQLWNWHGLDVVNAHERDPAAYVRGMRRGLAYAAEGVLPLATLITHATDIGGLDDAFRLMVERPDGFLKSVVRFDVR